VLPELFASACEGIFSILGKVSRVRVEEIVESGLHALGQLDDFLLDLLLDSALDLVLPQASQDRCDYVVLGFDDVDVERIDQELDLVEGKGWLLDEEVIDLEEDLETSSLIAHGEVGDTGVFDRGEGLFVDPESDPLHLWFDLRHLQEGSGEALFGLNMSNVELELRVDVDLDSLGDDVRSREDEVLDAILKVLVVVLDLWDGDLLQLLHQEWDDVHSHLKYEVAVYRAGTGRIGGREVSEKLCDLLVEELDIRIVSYVFEDILGRFNHVAEVFVVLADLSTDYIGRVN